ncbi:MAG TPA: hypothetical protein DDW91_06870 [Shewanella frigidimarina]|nr:hypothetical protein [Shewanella frigidimarina]
MKISKKELIQMKASKECLGRFITQTNNTDDQVYLSSLIGGVNSAADLFWLAGEKLDKECVARFYCDRALINIEKIKPYCSDANLEAVMGYLKNPSTYAGRAEYTCYEAGANAYDAGDSNAVIAANTAYNIIYAVRSDYAIARPEAYQVREAYDSVWSNLADDATVNDLLFKMLEGDL